MYKNIIIYYFSGTGNARNVSYWIAREAEKTKCKVRVFDISNIDRTNISEPPHDALIGFVSPTHGFNLPPIMLNFLAGFPKGRNSVFLINTRAGLKMGKFFLPGLSGIALYYALFVLKLKKYQIVGMRSIDLPSNWISLHPGIKKKVADSMHDHYEVIAKNFAEKMIRGKRNYRALWDIVQDVVISPIAIAYYVAGRFFLAKTFIANKDCTMCGLCINSCPVKAIKKIDDRPFWTYRCESCMKCMNLCPERAIQTCHGFVALVFYLVYATIIAFLYNKFPLKDYMAFQNGLIRFTIETIIVMPFLLIGYRLMHYLMRFWVFERFISTTSLTWYKFWRRYKAPKP